MPFGNGASCAKYRAQGHQSPPKPSTLERKASRWTYTGLPLFEPIINMIEHATWKLDNIHVQLWGGMIVLIWNCITGDTII